jgi:hypothetical protein
MLYKTCNDCRVHARRNSRAAIDERVAAAAANDDDDDNASRSLIALGFDYVDAANAVPSSSAAASEEDMDTYAATTMRASIIEGRRLAAIQRRRDTMSRLSSRLISHHHAHIQIYTDTDAEFNNALLSSSAAASSSTDSSGYFVDEPDPEPEPDDPGP